MMAARRAMPARVDPRFSPSKAQIEVAREEIQEKGLGEIHRETALVWAARGLAALELYEETSELPWLTDAEEYLHEALEHAALASEMPAAADGEQTVARIALLLQSAAEQDAANAERDE